MQSLASQIYAFSVTVLMGVVVGILYDFYRVTRGEIRPGRVTGYLGDLFFWIMSTSVATLLLLIGNWGEIRFYVVLGVVGGVLIYIKLISRWLTDLLRHIIFLIKRTVFYIAKCIRFILFVVSYPFILARNIIIIPVGFLGRAVTRLMGLGRTQVRRVITGPAGRWWWRLRRALAGRWKKLIKK